MRRVLAGQGVSVEGWGTRRAAGCAVEAGWSGMTTFARAWLTHHFTAVTGAAATAGCLPMRYHECVFLYSSRSTTSPVLYPMRIWPAHTDPSM